MGSFPNNNKDTLRGATEFQIILEGNGPLKMNEKVKKPKQQASCRKTCQTRSP